MNKLLEAAFIICTLKGEIEDPFFTKVVLRKSTESFSSELDFPSTQMSTYSDAGTGSDILSTFLRRWHILY